MTFKLTALCIALATLPATLADSAAGGAVKLTMPPPIPKAYPPSDESGPIPDSFLTDPLVADAVAYVKSVVPAALLAIPPSTYVSPCVATYNPAAAAENCYWPAGLCVRTTATADYLADVVTCPNQNVWGLTYDDGPTNNVVDGAHVDDTTALRSALTDNNNQKATFFVVGSMGVSNPGEIAATFKDGHQIGLHTWTHWTSTSLTNEQFVAELKYSEALVYNSTGVVPRFWRPPCGDYDDRIRAIAHALGYRTVPWTTSPSRDSGDADIDKPTTADSDKLLDTITETWFTSQAGFISLEHDIDAFTTNLGIRVQQAVKAAGASFPLKAMPVADCISEPSYQFGPPGVNTSASAGAPAGTVSANQTASTGSSTASPSASATNGAASASSTSATNAAASTGSASATNTASGTSSGGSTSNGNSASGNGTKSNSNSSSSAIKLGASSDADVTHRPVLSIIISIAIVVSFASFASM